jgi:hypothetical protein
MHAFTASIVASLLVSPLLLAACGGRIAPSSSDQTKSGESTTASSQTTKSEVHAAPCVDPVPVDGTLCSTDPTMCEYGGSDPMSLCTTVAFCDGPTGANSVWHVTPPYTYCVATPSQNQPECPATFSALPNGAPCPRSLDPIMHRGACAYPEGFCGCGECVDLSNLNEETQWWCKAFTAAPDGCPDPRPVEGTVCSTEGQTCTYGEMCDPVMPWFPMVCKNGMWTHRHHGDDCTGPGCMSGYCDEPACLR